MPRLAPLGGMERLEANESGEQRRGEQLAHDALEIRGARGERMYRNDVAVRGRRECRKARISASGRSKNIASN
jgi:hypothetical protein